MRDSIHNRCYLQKSGHARPWLVSMFERIDGERSGRWGRRRGAAVSGAFRERVAGARRCPASAEGAQL